jgi:membrane protein YqaA with SNARE-associated domain
MNPSSPWWAFDFLTDDASLLGLGIASFLAATLLPGGSEAVLAGTIYTRPALWPAALAVATLGNTVGGMSTYLLGRLFPERALPRRLETVRRWGPLALLFAWLPFVGDALCGAAGWLRLNWIACMVWMGVGKLGRYAVITWLLLEARGA